MPPAAAAGDVIVMASSSPSREGKRARDDVNNDEKKSTKKTKKNLNNDDGDGPVAKKKKKKQDKDQKNQNQKKKKKEENNWSSSSSSSHPSSSCIFPMSRVRRLVRGEAGISNTDARTTNDSVFLINKASEMFLQRFAQDAFANAVKNRKKSISYQNLSSTVCNGKRYEFLSDFVPEKVKAEDALKARALVET